MFWFITACVGIALLMLTYNVEIHTGSENRFARLVSLAVVGGAMGTIYVNYIAA